MVMQREKIDIHWFTSKIPFGLFITNCKQMKILCTIFRQYKRRVKLARRRIAKNKRSSPNKRSIPLI